MSGTFRLLLVVALSGCATASPPALPTPSAEVSPVAPAEPVPAPGTAQLERAIEIDTAIVGSPATVRDEVERHLAASGGNYFVGRFVYGNMPFDAAMRSLDLFAREVMPHFTR